MSQPALTPDQFDTPKEYVRAWLPRMIPLALAMVVIQVLFAGSYMGAFGKTDAHHAPVIIVGSTKGNAATIANKLNAQKGQPVWAYTSTDEKASIEKLKHDEAVAVYVFRPTLKGKQVDQMYYASAQGAARAQVAKTVGQSVGVQSHRQVQMHDVVPAKSNDPRATAPFYLVLAWMVGAYVLAAAMSTMIGPRAGSLRGSLARVALFAGYAVLSGLAGAWLATSWLDTLGGSYLKIAGVGMFLVFAVSMVTYGLTALLGPIGVGCAILLFVVLGNPSAGGAFNYDVLPEPWRSVGPYMPNGAGTDAVRSLAYFDGANMARPMWVLLAWLAAGAWVLFMIGNNTYGFGRKRKNAAVAEDAGAVVAEQRGKHVATEPVPEGSDSVEGAAGDAPVHHPKHAAHDGGEYKADDVSETAPLPTRQPSDAESNEQSDDEPRG